MKSNAFSPVQFQALSTSTNKLTPLHIQHICISTFQSVKHARRAVFLLDDAQLFLTETLFSQRQKNLTSGVDMIMDGKIVGTTSLMTFPPQTLSGRIRPIFSCSTSLISNSSEKGTRSSGVKTANTYMTVQLNQVLPLTQKYHLVWNPSCTVIVSLT